MKKECTVIKKFHLKNKKIEAGDLDVGEMRLEMQKHYEKSMRNN